MKEELQNNLKDTFETYWFNRNKDFVSIVQVDLDEIINCCIKLKVLHEEEMK